MNTVLPGQQAIFKIKKFEDKNNSQSRGFLSFLKKEEEVKIDRVKTIEKKKQKIPFKLIIKNMGYENKKGEYILQSNTDDTNQFQFHDVIDKEKYYYINWKNDYGVILNVGNTPLEISVEDNYNLERIML